MTKSKIDQSEASNAGRTTKDLSLDPYREERAGTVLTTDQGIRIPHTDDSLKAGARGPTLMEDFHFREKMTHFDHERIPERVVHARGSGAHGYFQAYESQAQYTRAAFLQDPSVKTPVFVRFSTVAGSRGSADTVRDVRGFATKFYTTEGNFDLVGNNIPVFFIQDGIKFPDVIHAVKPEPDNEIPQASSAHDTFWDFVGLVPETAHMVMWVMSDRAIPRSYRMMEGFGVHTFRLVNAQGKSHLVKFHWKPLLGVHSLVWDEAQKLTGKDPDYHRRDLWEAIENGHYPEYELGLQIIAEGDDLKYGFDLLDPTKVLPEEIIPVKRVGKLTLDRNPDNFFAETEQVAFHTGNVVPGIDFTNDPLLQARLFSYLDTQLLRLGGPNFTEIPINRPIVPVHNHQQDGLMRQRIITGKANYHPNSIGGGCPMLGSPQAGAFMHFAEKIDGHKIRERSDSFKDHVSQAAMFLHSLSDWERAHLVEACRFELGKVGRKEIRQRVVDLFSRIDVAFAREVAAGIGVSVADDAAAPPQPKAGAQDPGGKGAVTRSPALSMANTVKDTIKSRRVAVLAADGFASGQLEDVKRALEGGGAQVDIVSWTLGPLLGDDGSEIEAGKTFLTVGSVQYDAVFVPGGKDSLERLKLQGDAIHFLNEAFKHAKPIGAVGEGVDLLLDSSITGVEMADGSSTGQLRSDRGVVTYRDDSALDDFIEHFIEAIAQHRHWDRPKKSQVPA